MLQKVNGKFRCLGVETLHVERIASAALLFGVHGTPVLAVLVLR
jgi:hypothetical protein